MGAGPQSACPVRMPRGGRSLAAAAVGAGPRSACRPSSRPRAEAGSALRWGGRRAAAGPGASRRPRSRAAAAGAGAAAAAGMPPGRRRCCCGAAVEEGLEGVRSGRTAVAGFDKDQSTQSIHHIGQPCASHAGTHRRRKAGAMAAAAAATELLLLLLLLPLPVLPPPASSRRKSAAEPCAVLRMSAAWCWKCVRSCVLLFAMGWGIGGVRGVEIHGAAAGVTYRPGGLAAAECSSSWAVARPDSGGRESGPPGPPEPWEAVRGQRKKATGGRKGRSMRLARAPGACHDASLWGPQ